VCEHLHCDYSVAVSYRRRDFESRAMVREICRRHGYLGQPERPLAPNIQKGLPVRVGFVTASNLSDRIKACLNRLLAGINAIEWFEVVSALPESGGKVKTWNITDIDACVLVLTAGVLADKDCVQTLLQLISSDEGSAARSHSVVCTHWTAHPGAWEFDGPEVSHAPAKLKVRH